jgi:uncharacterized protein
VLPTLRTQDINSLCRRFQVERLELFGSAVRPDFDPEHSDLDFLAWFPANYDFGPWMIQLQEFEDEQALPLQRPADVVLDSALPNPRFRHEAAKTRTLIYDTSKTDRAWRVIQNRCPVAA